MDFLRAVNRSRIVFVLGIFFILGVSLYNPSLAQASGWEKVLDMAALGQPNNNGVFCFETFKGKLYAGMDQGWEDPNAKAELWVTSDGVNWSEVTSFSATYSGITSMEVFGDYLYVTEFPSIVAIGGGAVAQDIKIQRSADGVNWDTALDNNTLGDPDLKVAWSLKTFKDHLYTTVLSYDNDTQSSKGMEVLRSSDGRNWEKAAAGGFNGDINNLWSIAMEEFAGSLYIGTFNINVNFQPASLDVSALDLSVQDLPALSSSGTEIWRSSTGDYGTWEQVNSDGFGISNPQNNYLTYFFAVFKGELYASVYNASETADAVQFWKTGDGRNWNKVTTNGLEGIDDSGGSLLMPMVVNGVFWMGIDQPSGGSKLFSSEDGINWRDSNHEGSADANNYGLYAMTLFNNYLYSGFSNTNGVQIWRSGPINVLSISSASFPPATLGSPYNANVEISSGTAPYSCSYTGDLPPGLTISSSCVISGVPTHASDHTFTLTVQDSGTPAQSASKEFTISVSPGLPDTGANVNLYQVILAISLACVSFIALSFIKSPK